MAINTPGEGASSVGNSDEFEDQSAVEGGNFWGGLDDRDHELPPDPLELDDTAWLADQQSRDADRLRHEPSDVPDDDPPELTAEEFGQEILVGGADAAAAVLGSLEPGPRVAALLAMLKPASLSPASMVSVIAATERLASWVQARQHRWLATFACPGVAAPVSDLRAYASQPGQPLSPRKARNKDKAVQDDDLACSGSGIFGDPDVETVLNETAMKVAAAEIGAALHFSPIAAQRRVCQAVEFAVDLPETLRALEAGSIDRGRSLTIAERTQNLPVELRRKVEQAVLPKATNRTPGQLRGIVDRAVISVDPAAAKKRHEKAVAQRNVTHRAAEDGMGIFRAELSADKAQLAYSVIDQLAYQLKRTSLCESDPRGVGALRADVFSDLIDQLASTGTVTIRTTVRRRASTSATPPAHPATNGTDPREDPDCHQSADRSAADVGEPPASPDRADQLSNAEPGAGSGRPVGDDLFNATGDSVGGAGGATFRAADGDGASAHADGDDSPCGAVGSADAESGSGAAVPGGADLSTSNARPGEQNQGRRSNPAVGPDLHDGDWRPEPCDGHDPLRTAGHLDTGLGTHQGRVTHLNVTIAASTLAGLDERPGDLDGHGPIPADLARAIAASASTIAAIAIKPGCGTGLDLGRTVYRPRLAQRDHVTTRDQTCRFPGCRRAAKRCQIDHSDEYCPGRTDGGVTCPCNLQCLCVFHHGLKTGGLWDSIQHDDASVTWTSPTGRTYSTHPRQWPTEEDDRANNSPADSGGAGSLMARFGGECSSTADSGGGCSSVAGSGDSTNLATDPSDGRNTDSAHSGESGPVSREGDSSGDAPPF